MIDLRSRPRGDGAHCGSVVSAGAYGVLVGAYAVIIVQNATPGPESIGDASQAACRSGPVQLPNFVTPGRPRRSHMTQNRVKTCPMESDWGEPERGFSFPLICEAKENPKKLAMAIAKVRARPYLLASSTGKDTLATKLLEDALSPFGSQRVDLEKAVKIGRPVFIER